MLSNPSDVIGFEIITNESFDKLERDFNDFPKVSIPNKPTLLPFKISIDKSCNKVSLLNDLLKDINPSQLSLLFSNIFKFKINN